MDTVYFLCAAIGGTVLVIQTLLLMIGLGGDDVAHGIDVHDGDFHDGDVHDGDGDAAFKVLSFKTAVAFLTFFGLAGLAGGKAEMNPTAVIAIAVAAGMIAVFVVAYIMTGLSKLQSTGNVSLDNAVGSEARVYLRIPGEHAGVGKVTVPVQGRSIECKATTAGPAIPTGAQVRVIAAAGPDTVEVQPMETV